MAGIDAIYLAALRHLHTMRCGLRIRRARSRKARWLQVAYRLRRIVCNEN
jgi:hypothetical protein